jgi:hypothetical protein
VEALAGRASFVTGLGHGAALAATINVNARCALPQAITSANNNSRVGGCAKGAGADTIVLPTNSTQTLTRVNNTTPFFGPTGLPVIRSAITIAGNGSTIRRAPTAPNFKIFSVAGTGNLSLQRTTVSGGRGGILNIGSVSLTDSTISGNTGTGVVNTYICCDDYGELTAINSTISGNTRAGIDDFEAGGVTLRNTTVSGNGGPGVLVGRFSGLTMSNTTVSGNGGVGVENYASSVTINNSTISGNAGGGVYSNDNSANTSINNSTITNNTSPNYPGGGVRNELDSYLTLSRTLISGNTSPRGSEVYNDGDSVVYSDSVVNADDFNVFGHSGLTSAEALVGFTPGATDITATSDGDTPTPLSGVLNTALANNGGATRTHALPASSPAVDAVLNGTCPPPFRDQRGFERPVDGNGDGGVACDIGSYERQ